MINRFAIPDVPKLIVLATVIFNLLSIAAIITIGTRSSTALFTVDALSERLTIKSTVESHPPAWGEIPFTKDQFFDDEFSNDELVKFLRTCVNPRLRFPQILSTPITLTATSRGNNQFEIVVTTDENSSLGKILCDNNIQTPAPGHIILEWRGEKKTLSTLPFSGILTLGDVPTKNNQNPKLLISGTLIVETISTPFESAFVTTERVLRLGDRLQFYEKIGENGQAISHGILRMKDSSFHVVAHTTAAEARILRVGQDENLSASIAPTIWTKIESQSEWVIFTIIGVLVLNILAIIQTYSNTSIIIDIKREIIRMGKRNQDE